MPDPQSSAEGEQIGPADDELDGLRIRRLTEMRRASQRSAGYCVIGSLICLGLAAKMIHRALGHHWLYVALHAILAGFLLGLAIWLLFQRRRLARRATSSSLGSQSTAPYAGSSGTHSGSPFPGGQ